MTAKRRLGFFYGAAAGLAFSVTFWGRDGFLLSQAHAYFPWIKFLIGAPLAMLTFGLAGWLTSRFDRPLLGFLFWLLASAFMAWLTVRVLFNFSPAALGWIEPPLRPLLHYAAHDRAFVLLGTSFAWTAVATFILAAIQIPMIEQAAFSTSALGRFAPHFVCAAIMLINGAMIEGFYNQSMREAVVNLDQTIQFSLDTHGMDTTSDQARELHAASLRTIQNIITPERRLAVSQFDSMFGSINVAVNFGGNWADCLVVYGRPVNCKAVQP